MDEQHFLAVVRRYGSPHEPAVAASSGVARTLTSSCGDMVEVMIDQGADNPMRIRVACNGCSICRAAAEIVNQLAALARTPEELQAWVEWAVAVVDGSDPAAAPSIPGDLGATILTFSVLKHRPSRRECARVVWTTTREALVDSWGGRQ